MAKGLKETPVKKRKHTPKRPKTEKEIQEMKEFQIQLGQRIAEVRVDKDMSQLDLADKLGSEQQNLQRIEKGKVNVSSFMLNKIARHLGVTLSELVDF